MNVTEIIRKIVREELIALYEAKKEKVTLPEAQITEKSVPEPYDRKSRTKLSKSQISKREKIGRAMLRDEKKVSEFRKKYGQDWESYLWAAASGAAKRAK